jgi:hypothetical protein
MGYPPDFWVGAAVRRVQLGYRDMSTESMIRVGAAPVGKPENGDGTSGDRRASPSGSFPVDEPARDPTLETAPR